MFTKIAHIPRQHYVWIDSSFTHEEPQGFVEAVWVGLTAIPARCWGINAILREGGALYRNIPPHFVSFEKQSVPWSLGQAQLWNCYGWNFTTLENEHLSGLRVSAWIDGKLFGGEYLFSAAHIDDSYSMTPEQDKEFFFIKLDNGRLTIQPTNRVVFIDKSFIVNKNPMPRLRLNNEVFNCEHITYGTKEKRSGDGVDHIRDGIRPQSRIWSFLRKSIQRIGL